MYVQCCVSAQLRLPPLAFLFILWAAFDSVEGGRKFVEFGAKFEIDRTSPRRWRKKEKKGKKPAKASLIGGRKLTRRSISALEDRLEFEDTPHTVEWANPNGKAEACGELLERAGLWQPYVLGTMY
ncbi:predicted protein [Plenodomus lingam JN3]|uniref:Predicted protein n=1 Tax=Leptosphaeria maculans (strain JN3 / isolate v23.1.3 / race Av1-4-5-6-7-8) TaxID=985895 RepID=E4ZU85_LEPMJ|nr:predicted protein [Plenodomus lingam JN3]CBX94964.1 predicted protein [Plenodomus lingam JN3]